MSQKALLHISQVWFFWMCFPDTVVVTTPPVASMASLLPAPTTLPQLAPLRWDTLKGSMVGIIIVPEGTNRLWLMCRWPCETGGCSCS